MPTYYRLPTPEEDLYGYACTVRGCLSPGPAAVVRRYDGYYDGAAVCPEHTDRLNREDHP